MLKQDRRHEEAMSVAREEARTEEVKRAEFDAFRPTLAEAHEFELAIEAAILMGGDLLVEHEVELG